MRMRIILPKELSVEKYYIWIICIYGHRFLSYLDSHYCTKCNGFQARSSNNFFKMSILCA